MVLANATLRADLKSYLLDGFSSQLGLPVEFLRIIRLYLGSLVIELEITRNETFPISDVQIASVLNTNEDYMPTLTWYFIVTGEVSSGLLEPVILIQVVATPQKCGELCIAACSAGSIAFGISVATIWYIYFYREGSSVAAARRKQRRRSTDKPLDRKTQRHDPYGDSSESDHEPFSGDCGRWVSPSKPLHDPFEQSAASSDADHEPFNEFSAPPNVSRAREPFEDNDTHAFEDSDSDGMSRARSKSYHPRGPYGTMLDCSPYGGPPEDEYSPSPQRPGLDARARLYFEGHDTAVVEVVPDRRTLPAVRWWWKRTTEL